MGRLLNGSEGTATFVTSLVGWLGINEHTAEPEDLDALSAYLNAWIEDQRPFNEFYDGAIELETTDGATATEPVGVLGTKAYLGAHTFPPTPSFITRGVFVVEQLLCQPLPDDLPAEAFGGEVMTEREVLETHSSQPCATCHVFFDSFGAAFQNLEPETNSYDSAFAPLGADFLLNPPGTLKVKFRTSSSSARKRDPVSAHQHVWRSTFTATRCVEACVAETAKWSVASSRNGSKTTGASARSSFRAPRRRSL